MFHLLKNLFMIMLDHSVYMFNSQKEHLQFLDILIKKLSLSVYHYLKSIF